MLFVFNAIYGTGYLTAGMNNAGIGPSQKQSQRPTYGIFASHHHTLGFCQIRCPGCWGGVGRDTSTRRCLRIPRNDSQLLYLSSSKENVIGESNRPDYLEKWGSTVQWGQKTQEILYSPCSMVHAWCNGKQMTVASKTQERQGNLRTYWGWRPEALHQATKLHHLNGWLRVRMGIWGNSVIQYWDLLQCQGLDLIPQRCLC